MSGEASRSEGLPCVGMLWSLQGDKNTRIKQLIDDDHFTLSLCQFTLKITFGLVKASQQTAANKVSLMFRPPGRGAGKNMQTGSQ